MGDITLKFDSNEQIRSVAGFVKSIFNVYNKSSLDTIKSLNSKLESLDYETILSVDLSNDEISLLDHICVILSNIGADEVIAGCDVSSKIARAIGPKEAINDKLTKEELFKKAQERFSSWARMYANPDVTVEQMYEDMSCSVFSGDANWDEVLK